MRKDPVPTGRDCVIVWDCKSSYYNGWEELEKLREHNKVDVGAEDIALEDVYLGILSLKDGMI